MAASYWLSVKAIPADVVNENANVLDALRTIYNGGFDTVATACVVEVCKTPGIDVYALITTCILDPGNPHGTSRTEQSAGRVKRIWGTSCRYLGNIMPYNKLSSPQQDASARWFGRAITITVSKLLRKKATFPSPTLHAGTA